MRPRVSASRRCSMRCDCSHESETGRRQLRVSVQFDPHDVQLTRTPFGIEVTLADAKNGGEEGAPALPRQTVKVAVPLMQWPTDVSIVREEFIPLTQGPTFVAPVQRLRAGVREETRPGQDGETVRLDHIKRSTCRPCPDPERDPD